MIDVHDSNSQRTFFCLNHFITAQTYRICIPTIDEEAEPLTSSQPYAPHDDRDAASSSWKKWSVRAGIVTLVAVLGSVAMDAAFRGPNVDVALREAGTWSSGHGKMCEGKHCHEEAKVRSHSDKHATENAGKSGKEVSSKSDKEAQSSAGDLFDDMRE